MKRQLRILGADISKWHKQDYKTLNHKFILEKKEYSNIQMHSFSSMIINRKLLWNFGRNVSMLFDDLKDIENTIKDQISDIRYFVRVSNTTLAKIVRKVANIEYHKALSMYNKRLIKQNNFSYVDRAICFVHSGDDLHWSHFMQDTSHLIINTIEFLKKNKSVKILFFDQRSHIEPFIRDICGLENEIKYMLNETIKVGQLFIPTYMPQNRFYDRIVPLKYLEAVRKLVQKNCGRSEEKYLIYQTRKNVKRRIVLNEDEVVDALKNYSDENNLKFIEFIHSDFNFNERFNLYYNSDVVIAPHGGASYHMFACKPETKFVEFVVEGSCGLFAPSIVNYHALMGEEPFYGNGYHRNYHINTQKLIKILNNQSIINLYEN